MGVRAGGRAGGGSARRLAGAGGLCGWAPWRTGGRSGGQARASAVRCACERAQAGARDCAQKGGARAARSGRRARGPAGGCERRGRMCESASAGSAAVPGARACVCVLSDPRSRLQRWAGCGAQRRASPGAENSIVLRRTGAQRQRALGGALRPARSLAPDAFPLVASPSSRLGPRAGRPAVCSGPPGRDCVPARADGRPPMRPPAQCPGCDCSSARSRAAAAVPRCLRIAVLRDDKAWELPPRTRGRARICHRRL